jgi:hypothetical protein
MAGRSVLLRLSPPARVILSVTVGLLHAWDKILTIIIIRRKLRLDRCVSASSNSLVKGLQSRLVRLVLTTNYGKNMFN